MGWQGLRLALGHAVELRGAARTFFTELLRLSLWLRASSLASYLSVNMGAVAAAVEGAAEGTAEGVVEGRLFGVGVEADAPITGRGETKQSVGCTRLLPQQLKTSHRRVCGRCAPTGLENRLVSLSPPSPPPQPGSPPAGGALCVSV